MNSLSKVEICNLALSLIGSEPINSLDDDSKASRVLARFYDSAREAVLSESEWSFAITHRELTVPAVDNDSDWEYIYNVPVDCISALGIEDFPNYPWEIRGQYLYTDLTETIVLRYVQDVTDENKFDPGFARVLAHRLAADMAVYLKDKGAAEYMQKYEFELRRAKGKNTRYAKNRKRISVPYEYKRFQVRGHSQW